MATYPLSILSAQVTAAGISAPSYADILLSLQASFRLIYGADAYIEPDSQDGQMLAVFAKAIYDSNQMAIAVFNSFSPTYAQGAGLSSNVKINGLQRLAPSYSTATGDVVGVAGTVITNGTVKDENGNIWALPETVTIPLSGTITVTVTAVQPGAVIAPAGTINLINSPSYGWQTFTSVTDAVAGAPVETDATLRQRQAVSTELPSVTPTAALYAALANLAGVERVAVYENYTGTTDANGIPAHSICVVIQGGDVAAIAQTIGLKKTPGAGTYGSTSQSYLDPITNISYTIHFYVLAHSTIKVAVSGTAYQGYGIAVATKIQDSIAAFINGLAIGEDVQFNRLYSPAYLPGDADAKTYEITGITIAIGAGTPGTADLPIAFNYAAACVAATDVTVTIV